MPNAQVEEFKKLSPLERTGHGPMYANLELEARDAGMILHWPQRLPNTRLALAAAEWVRREHPDAITPLHKRLFEAPLCAWGRSG
jgi:hypothetical protein